MDKQTGRYRLHTIRNAWTDRDIETRAPLVQQHTDGNTFQSFFTLSTNNHTLLLRLSDVNTDSI